MVGHLQLANKISIVCIRQMEDTHSLTCTHNSPTPRLYFGIRGRDCAEVMADQMAAGLNGRLTSTAHACGICAGELKDYSHLGESAVSVCGGVRELWGRRLVGCGTLGPGVREGSSNTPRTSGRARGGVGGLGEERRQGGRGGWCWGDRVTARKP